MLKDAVGFAKQVLGLTRKSQQHEEDIKGLRQEVKEVRQELRALAEAVQQQRFEQQRDRETGALERENLLLRLELLLRSERQLPPAAPSGHAELDVLQKQIAILQKENEELRKRLEQQDKSS